MSNTNKTASWIYIAIAALLALNIYQWYNNNNLSKLNDEKETELFQMEKVSAELESDHEAAMSSLEELRSDNQAANELIDSQKKELEDQKKKIKNLIWKSRELSKAKDEINNLNASVSGYISQINSLKAQNQQLSAVNTTLKKEKSELTESLTQEKEVTMNLSIEKEELTKTQAQLNQQKEVLSGQVDMASAIKLNSLTVEGRQDKGDGESKEQKKVKKLDFLRICIKTETNMVVPSGQQDIYLRIISPGGTTVTRNDNTTGGVLTNKLDGTQMRYTVLGNFDYNNDDHEECFDWKPDHKLAKGLYNVEAYHREYQVGKGTFKLK